MLRFHFDLTPIDRVAPWGQGRTLHWFGLTDGRYCVEVDGIELLRYASRIEDPDEGPPWPDYYVVRLWEDVLAALPGILEPVPADLTGFLAAGVTGWAGPDDENADSPALDAAYSAFGDRCIDTHPLRFGPTLLWTRTLDPADSITVTWHFPQDPDGEIAFTAPRTGSATIPTGEFRTEVTAFHDRLFEAMRARVDQLAETGAPPSVELDLPGLIREHADRRSWLARALRRSADTDWDAVRAAIPILMPRASPDGREDQSAGQG